MQTSDSLIVMFALITLSVLIYWLRTREHAVLWPEHFPTAPDRQDVLGAVKVLVHRTAPSA